MISNNINKRKKTKPYRCEEEKFKRSNQGIKTRKRTRGQKENVNNRKKEVIKTQMTIKKRR